jgi:hypothetical protein
MIRHPIRAFVFAAVATSALATTAAARTIYDGSWSVLIVTQQGTCDRAYRYGIQIINGRVHYDGGAVNFAGQVYRGGNVRVNVSSGGARASGSGRLSRNYGRGRWAGFSGSTRCSGYWEAERRG